MKNPAIPGKLKMRLFPVVLDLFSKNDFHQVNIREISRLSGLSTSTIYKYFSSKEELVFAILSEKTNEIAELIKLHVQGLESTREILRKCFWVLMDYYDRNPGVAITAFITVPTRTWMRHRSYKREDVDHLFQETLQKGIDQKELSPTFTLSQLRELFFMFLTMQVQLWYYHGMKWKLVDTIPQFFPLFWKTVAIRCDLPPLMEGPASESF